MRGFLLALQFLTRIPVPAGATTGSLPLSRAVPWFPAAGLILGGLIAASAWAGSLWDPWLGALLAVLIWVGLSGGLHLDGLADLADALGAAHRDRERLIAVLSDPHLGGFGAIALILQLLSKVILLMLLLREQSAMALLLIPAWARLSAAWWSSTVPPLKPGLAAQLTNALSPATLLLWLVVLMSASLALAPSLLAAPILALLWRSYLSKRLGGMNGDALGAGIEIMESLMLLGLILLL